MLRLKQTGLPRLSGLARKPLTAWLWFAGPALLALLVSGAGHVGGLSESGRASAAEPSSAAVPVATDASKPSTAEKAAQRESEARLRHDVETLASDAFEGRGVGTQGLNLAADYLAKQFAEIGLKTDLYDGTPFQKFTMVIGAEMGEENRAAFVGPASDSQAASDTQRIELQLGEDFNPLALGISGKFDLPLVFVGYGITAPHEGYDDYAGLDVKGKAVIILRHEPQQDNPRSVFNGTKNSVHAPYMRKLSNAYEHGAAAVIFCNDEYAIGQRLAQRRQRWQQAINSLADEGKKLAQRKSLSPSELEQQRQQIDSLAQDVIDQGQKLAEEFDPLLGFTGAGRGSDVTHLPVLFCRRAVLDKLIKDAADTSLGQLEAEIDQGPKPRSFELTGWRLQGETSVRRAETEVKNVVAVLEGTGPDAEQTIVIGAHYDHLGYGGPESLAPQSKDVHNGADDNGSGTAALLEVARQLQALDGKLPRRVVFIAFTGEERGLLGSAYYVKHPLVPLDQTVAMLNMDMVGRLSDNKLILQGLDTAKEFDALVEQLNKQSGFKLTKQPGGFGPSDHASFYPHNIPVVHFFTGIHGDYHRPSDDSDQLNIEGMRRVADLVSQMAEALATAEQRPEYVAAQRPAPAMGSGGDRPYFGSIPDFGQSEPGYAISGVTKDSPAEKCGLRGGDLIVGLGESRIGNLNDFDSALRKYKGGDKVTVTVRREGKELTLTITLDPPR